MKRLLTLTLFLGIVWGQDIICPADGFDMFDTGLIEGQAYVYSCLYGHKQLYNPSFNEEQKQSRKKGYIPDFNAAGNWMGNPTEAWKEDAERERKKKEFETWERMQVAKMTPEQRNYYLAQKKADEQKRINAIASKRKADEENSNMTEQNPIIECLSYVLIYYLLKEVYGWMIL